VEKNKSCHSVVGGAVETPSRAYKWTLVLPRAFFVPMHKEGEWVGREKEKVACWSEGIMGETIGAVSNRNVALEKISAAVKGTGCEEDLVSAFSGFVVRKTIASAHLNNDVLRQCAVASKAEELKTVASKELSE